MSKKNKGIGKTLKALQKKASTERVGKALGGKALRREEPISREPQKAVQAPQQVFKPREAVASSNPSKPTNMEKVYAAQQAQAAKSPKVTTGAEKVPAPILMTPTKQKEVTKSPVNPSNMGERAYTLSAADQALIAGFGSGGVQQRTVEPVETREKMISKGEAPQAQALQAQLAQQAQQAQEARQAQQAQERSPKLQAQVAAFEKVVQTQQATPKYQELLKTYQESAGQDKEATAQLEKIQQNLANLQKSMVTEIPGTNSLDISLMAGPTMQTNEPTDLQLGSFSSFSNGGTREDRENANNTPGNTPATDSAQAPNTKVDTVVTPEDETVVKAEDPIPGTPPPVDNTIEGRRAALDKANKAYEAPKAEVVKMQGDFDPNEMLKAINKTKGALSGDIKTTYDPETGKYTVKAFGATVEKTPEEMAKMAELNMDNFLSDVPLDTLTDKASIEQLKTGEDRVGITGPDGVVAGTTKVTEAEAAPAVPVPDTILPSQYTADTAGSATAKAAQGTITGPGPQAAEATLTTPAEAALRDAQEEEAAKAIAATRPGAKDYAVGETTDEKFVVGDVEGPKVTLRDGIVIGEKEKAALLALAKERGVDPYSLPEYILERERKLQVGTAANKEYSDRFGIPPSEVPAQAAYYGSDFTADGGPTDIKDVPAFKVAATREAQTGVAAERIAQELGTAPSVDLEGREAITGTAAQGNAAQIGGIPTMKAATMQAVTGAARSVAAADMMSVVANIPNETTAAISEDPAKVMAAIDNEPATEVIAAIAALPVEALVSTQMEQLLAGMEDGKTPAWARPAVDAIEQQMAQRGLSASTVGRDALFNAIIQSALPMAQSNAQALQQRAAQNLSNEQQANLGSAQNTMTLRMQNLANTQTSASQTAQMANEIKLQQGSFKQQAIITSSEQKQQTALTNAQMAQQKSQQESAQKQQAAVSTLSVEAQSDLANLQYLNASASQNMTAAQQAKLTSYNAQVAKVMRQADLKQDMEKANISQSLQIEMQRISEMNAAAKDTMTAEQTSRLTNLQTLIDFRKTDAGFAQQMDMANMSNEQQMELAMLTDKAASDTANFTAENQFKLTRLNAIVDRNVRKSELEQRMKEVNLDANLKVELSELSEKNATSRANMTTEQQTRLANLNVLVDFRKSNAELAQQMDLVNLGNDQQIELANLAEKAATDTANFSEANRFRFQELNNHVSVMSQNEQLRQNADLAKLSTAEKISLSNLTQKNQASSESMSAQNIAELQVYEKKMAAGQINAQLAQQMGLANLSNKQQAAMFNAQIDSNMDMKQFDFNQQAALSNSQFMQTMTVKNFDNKQQATMQNATALATMDLANADALTKVSIENARNFLSMDMANLSNEQQANMLTAQSAQQTLLSNQAASNASKQFNASSEAQTNQFMANLAANMGQFNASQTNAMEQFNAQETNRLAALDSGNALEADKFNAQVIVQVDQFNSDQDFKAEQWNAANAQAIEQSNTTWRRNTNTAETAAQNAANQQTASFQFDMDKSTQAQLWQTIRDDAAFNFQEDQSTIERKVQVLNAALQNAEFMTSTNNDVVQKRNRLFQLLSDIEGVADLTGTGTGTGTTINVGNIGGMQ